LQTLRAGKNPSAKLQNLSQEMASSARVIDAALQGRWRRGEPGSCKKFGETVKKYTKNVKLNFDFGDNINGW
jgi:hypothetical protein